MSNKLKKKRKNGYIDKQHLSTSSLMLLFPLFLIVTVLPLIVSMHSYISGLGSYNWFITDDIAVDYFLYYKQWFFVFISSICLIVIIFRSSIDKKFLKMQIAFYPLMSYSILALISTLVSKHSAYGFSGIFEQFENIFCILGYALVAYYTYLALQNEFEVKLILNALAVGAIILGLIGTFQAFGLDFFNSEIGGSLIVEKGFDPSTLIMEFGSGRTYATLYNPNYVGVYSAMLIPVYAVLLFFSKKLFEYVLYSLVIITQIVSMLGSQSKTGIVSLALAAFLAIILIRKILIRRWYIVIPIVTSGIIGFFVLNTMQDNAYLNAIKSAFSINNTVDPNLTDIITRPHHIEVTYKGNTFYVSQNNSKDLLFEDISGNSIATQIIESKDFGYFLEFLDSRFDSIHPVVFYEDVADFGLIIDETPWYFHYDVETNQYLNYNRYGCYSPIESAPSLFFKGRENFASGRGYIWSRTLPLLSKHIILGSGAETFIFEYPQYDFVSMANYGFATNLITKPHSLYLQIGVQSGLLSLLCFLSFYGIYFVQSFKIYFKKKELNFNDSMGIAVLIGSLSYMISGFSNDSSITIAPVFWVLLGVGFAINRIIEAKTVPIEKF